VTEFATKDSKTLIDQLIDEQRSLTTVARFAQKHERAEIPLQSRYYRDLIPLTRPAAGEQYSFEVDLDKCSGCKACVVACHSLNGLEDDESWRAVGLLVSNEADLPYQQTVTTACHHCVDPACLNGCPVLAYEKDTVTGIVRHLDDQCIGCQYCVLKCPYEVPHYSRRLGIVRKCDMCSNRLAAGEAPACVQSCPSAAIRVTVVNQQVIRERHFTTNTAESFLPASPDAKYTLPTTTYISRKGLVGDFRAADASAVFPACPHWPLVFMLVLTQAGIGGIFVGAAAPVVVGATSYSFSILNAALVLLGMAASVFHLGRPLHSWRAFIGVRRSWLSREIVALNALAFGVLLQLAAGALPLLSSKGYGLAALVACSLTGAAALISSIMVYVDTPRVFWKFQGTAPRFIGTSLLLGCSGATLFFVEPMFFAAISVVACAKLAHELLIFRNLSGTREDPLARTARLMTTALSKVTAFRFVTLLLGGVVLAQLALAQQLVSPWIAPLIFLTLLLSEFSERSLFFRAVAQPKMPGGIS
jgi:Fe-S-cluster-containing dehydrogenase component/DMSO reductase anchor subunit